MTLIEQAKLKFVKGVIFRNDNIKCGCKNIRIKNPKFEEDSKAILVSGTNSPGNFTVYNKIIGKWAEITNSPFKVYELW